MPELKKISVDKGTLQEARKDGMIVSELLEAQDPSSNYVNTPFAKLSALERQLAIREIPVSGSRAVNLTDFYSGAGGVLYAEYIEQAIREGAAIHPDTALDADLCYMLSEIEGKTFQEAKAEFDTDQDVEMKRTAEGDAFSTVTLVLDETNVSMMKYARKIKFTDEYQRRTRIDQVKTVLNFIGYRMALEFAAQALTAAVNGNSGESNSAPNTNTAGALTWTHLVAFDLAFDPFKSNLWVAPPAMIQKLLSVSEMIDPLTGQNYQATGKFITPLGNVLKRSSASILSTTKILGVDTRFGVRRIREKGSYMVETDKIIDGQWNIIAISEYRGYAKDFAGSARTLTYTAS